MHTLYVNILDFHAHHNFDIFQMNFSDLTTNFYVKVYFAKQFAKLREIFFVSGEEMYIRSLARCISWSARGGKSGSNFCKTKGNSVCNDY